MPAPGVHIDNDSIVPLSILTSEEYTTGGQSPVIKSALVSPRSGHSLPENTNFFPVSAPESSYDRSYERAADSATMLNDLDFLESPEWQTMPKILTAAEQYEEVLVQEAKDVETGMPAYRVALKALWHNCPDALEIALDKIDIGSLPDPGQASDAEFMAQKLEFTRIRQGFVSLCHRFHQSSNSEGQNADNLKAGVSMIEARIEELLARQPDEQMSQLPGLIGRRDTIMLQSRIRDISRKLLARNLEKTCLPTMAEAEVEEEQEDERALVSQERPRF